MNKEEIQEEEKQKNKEENLDAEIYIITNLINNKKYVGITKEKYGNEDFGYLKRFNQHLINAFTKSKFNDCPRLYNSIRKHGKNNFKIELLQKCSINDRAKLEKEYIKKYNLNDDKYGYNISHGGDGRSVSEVNEEIRNKISLSQSNIGECNIKPYYKEGIQLGYYVKRRNKGKVYIKYFTSKKFSIDENYKKSKEFLEKLRSNLDNIELNKYNRKENLPTNITIAYNKANTKQIGYKVILRKYKIHKSFTNSDLSLETNLQNAKDYLEKVLEEVKTTCVNSEKSESDNTQPSS